MNIRIKKLHPDAILPKYQTDGAAGCDLHAYVPEDHGIKTRRLAIFSGEAFAVSTGIAIQMPNGYEAQIRGRSGLALAKVFVHPGTIDADFTGELKVIIHNQNQWSYHIHHGDRIAQLVIAPVVRATWEEVDELEATDRGSGGFGSTGKGMK